MAEIRDFSKSKQIRALLYVLAAGIVCASGLLLSMLYYYNPTGSYLAKNVLLSPDSAFSLQYVDSGSKIKGKIAFDRVDFSYWDVSTRMMKVARMDKGRYSTFYDLVEGDVSIIDPNEVVLRRFNVGHPAVMALKVKDSTDSTLKTIDSVFTQVEFAEGGDYYRVQLRQQGAGAWWAYYYHPGILKQVFKILDISP